MQEMTDSEYRSFLLDRPRTGKAATVRADGRPHLTPIWFDLDGDELIFTSWHETVKVANLRRDPRIAICIDDEAPPFSYVIIEGTATISADPAELRHWATRLGGRYMGPDQAEALGQRNSVPGELLIRVTPTYIIARKNIAD